MKYIQFPLVLLTILLVCNFFTSCNDDEGSGVPVIHHIRLVDPEKADSTFTDVNPGTMIVVIGENLTDVKKYSSTNNRFHSTATTGPLPTLYSPFPATCC